MWVSSEPARKAQPGAGAHLFALAGGFLHDEQLICMVPGEAKRAQGTITDHALENIGTNEAGF